MSAIIDIYYDISNNRIGFRTEYGHFPFKNHCMYIPRDKMPDAEYWKAFFESEAASWELAAPNGARYLTVSKIDGDYYVKSRMKPNYNMIITHKYKFHPKDFEPKILKAVEKMKLYD